MFYVSLIWNLGSRELKDCSLKVKCLCVKLTSAEISELANYCIIIAWDLVKTEVSTEYYLFSLAMGVSVRYYLIC